MSFRKNKNLQFGKFYLIVVALIVPEILMASLKIWIPVYIRDILTLLKNKSSDLFQNSRHFYVNLIYLDINPISDKFPEMYAPTDITFVYQTASADI